MFIRQVDQPVGVPDDSKLRRVDVTRTMVVGDDPAHMVNYHLINFQFLHDAAGNRRTFDLLVFPCG